MVDDNETSPGGDAVRGRRKHATDSSSGFATRFVSVPIIGGLIVAAAVISLIIQNGESAQIDWLFFHFTSPRWVILFLTMVAGGIVWELAKLAFRRRRHK